MSKKYSKKYDGRKNLHGKVPTGARKKGMYRPSVDHPVSPQQFTFACEWAKDMNALRAAAAAGYKNPGVMGSRLLNPKYYPNVLKVAEEQRALINARAIMQADDIRRYIHTICQFCPTDYLEPGPRGSWMTNLEGLKKLPIEIKQIIEYVDRRVKTLTKPDGTEIKEELFYIHFIPKAEAMKLAAKYGLVEKHRFDGTLRWDDVIGEVSDKPIPDVIEAEVVRAISYTPEGVKKTVDTPIPDDISDEEILAENVKLKAQAELPTMTSQANGGKNGKINEGGTGATDPRE